MLPATGSPTDFVVASAVLPLGRCTSRRRRDCDCTSSQIAADALAIKVHQQMFVLYPNITNSPFNTNSFCFFLRLDLLYKTRRCYWDFITEQNKYLISPSREAPDLAVQTSPSNSDFAELSKNQIFLPYTRSTRLASLLIVLTARRCSRLYILPTICMPCQAVSTTRPVSCLSCSDFTSAFAASWCGVVPCDCLHCIRCYYYWIVNLQVKLDIIGSLILA